MMWLVAALVLFAMAFTWLALSLAVWYLAGPPVEDDGTPNPGSELPGSSPSGPSDRAE